MAFGTAETIAHRRRCRYAISTRRFTAKDNVRQHQLQPDFFVIPGLGGLPGPCLESSASASFKTMPPNVIICDPTVIDKVEKVDLVRVLTLTMGRCLSVLTADALRKGTGLVEVFRFSFGKSVGRDIDKHHPVPGVAGAGRGENPARGDSGDGARIFLFFAGEALRLAGEVLPSVHPGVTVELMREPVGPVGLITP